MPIDRGKVLSKLRSVQGPPLVPRSELTANDPINDDWVIRRAGGGDVLFIDRVGIPNEVDVDESFTVEVEVVNAATLIDADDGDECDDPVEDVRGFEYELTVSPSWGVSDTVTECLGLQSREVIEFDLDAPSGSGSETIEIEAKGASRPDTDEWLAGGSRSITINDDSDGGGGGGGGDDDPNGGGDDPEPEGSIDSISITDTEWLSSDELEVTIEVEGTDASGLTVDGDVEVSEGVDLLGDDFFTFTPLGDVDDFTGTVDGIDDPQGTGDLTVEAFYTDANGNEGSDSIDIAPYDDGGDDGDGGDDEPSDDWVDDLTVDCTVPSTVEPGETVTVEVEIDGMAPAGVEGDIGIDVLANGTVVGTGTGFADSYGSEGDDVTFALDETGDYTIDVEVFLL